MEHSKNKTIVLGNVVPVLGMKLKRGCYVYWLFFEIGICSAISLKWPRRELSIDVAGNRFILKNYQHTHYPRVCSILFSFIPKMGTAFPKTGVRFYCEYLNYLIRNLLVKLRWSIF